MPVSAEAEATPPVPTIPNIHKAVLAAIESPGQSLEMDNWHTCETTHCRAGWVIHLAGKAGYDLAKRFDNVLAAMKIYSASGYEISPCRFFDSNEDAMADIRRCAELPHA